MNFECHITCDLKDAAVGEAVAADRGWHTSQIERDPLLGKASHFYLTKHNTNYIDLYFAMHETSEQLRASGVNVLRQKIELIMFDTKGKS